MISPLSIFGLLREFNRPLALNHANIWEKSWYLESFLFQIKQYLLKKDYALPVSAKRSRKNLCKLNTEFFLNISVQSDHCAYFKAIFDVIILPN